MYVSTHTYGAYYEYNRKKNIFFYIGKDTREGLPLSPKYPHVIKMDGSHPILYAAKGSHGLWGSPGNTHSIESLKIVPNFGTGLLSPVIASIIWKWKTQ